MYMCIYVAHSGFASDNNDIIEQGQQAIIYQPYPQKRLRILIHYPRFCMKI